MILDNYLNKHHFQKCDFWKCKKIKSVKFRVSLKCQEWWYQKSFPRRFENDTFESVIPESVIIKSVGVDRLSLYQIEGKI